LDTDDDLSQRCERHPQDGFRLAQPLAVSTRTERAMAAVARALLPPAPAPRSTELDARVLRHTRVMLQYMPVGARVAILFFFRVLAWAPLWRGVACARLCALTPERASSVLAGIASSRLWPLRLLLQGPKALILTTYFDQDEVHRAIGYEPKGFLRERIARRSQLLKLLDERPYPAEVAE
jgi:hypothetical protein